MGLGLVRNPKFYQGYFKPQNPEKYIGKEVPIYRSGIELKFFKFLDTNPNVQRWNSEGITIPYYDKVRSKWRTYYVDNYVEIMEGTILKKYLIEIKPMKETKEPKASKGKKKSSLLYEQATHITNTCKWAFAMDFCKKHNMDFLLLGYSEKEGFTHVKLNFG